MEKGLIVQIKLQHVADSTIGGVHVVGIKPCWGSNNAMIQMTM